MNMITCDQTCRHQKDGYCGLNHIASLTSDINAKCGYYEPQKAPAKHSPPSPKNTKGL